MNTSSEFSRVFAWLLLFLALCTMVTTPRTNLITIESFAYSYANLMDCIVKANDARISKAHNLIIDVRGNDGGSDFSYNFLLRYLYTHPYNTVTTQFLASKDNMKIYKAISEDTTRPKG